LPCSSQISLCYNLILMRKRTGRRPLRPGFALLLAVVFAGGARAATFTVTSLADSGPGSLRQAVLDANASAGADDVVFAPGVTGTITLTFASGEIPITDSLFIHGPGAAALTVSANFRCRIFHVESPAATPIDVTLSGLTLTQGFAASITTGGAVYSNGENLTILNSVISDSTAGVFEDASGIGCGGNVGFGGGGGVTLQIADSTLTGGNAAGFGMSSGGNLCMLGGKLILERSTVSGGEATNGGGLSLQALMEDSTISSSTISGNQGDTTGGGISLTGGSPGVTVTIDSSTISGNTAGLSGSAPGNGFGGGAYLANGNLRIVNSTVSGNLATGWGGGISAQGSLLLRLTTVTGNTANIDGGSILVYPTPIELDHAIVANGTPEDLAAVPGLGAAVLTITANYSLVEAPEGGVVPVGAHNLIGVDPLLGPLADNGGPTLTHLPLPGSPVIDAGDPAIPSPPPADQRGFQRIIGPAVDLGAVEVGGAAIAEAPTLSPLGIAVLSALLLGAGVWRLRQPASGSP